MEYSYPIGMLSTHKELGDKALGKEIYPYITELGTLDFEHEVPRIFYRVLLNNRLAEGVKFTFEFKDYTRNTVAEIKTRLKEEAHPDDGVAFIEVPRSKSLRSQIDKILKVQNYEQNEPVNKFISSKPESFIGSDDGAFLLTYLNKEKRSTIIIGTIKQGLYPWNVMAALSSKLLPWYFEKPLTDEEYQLVISIDKNDEEFLKAVDTIFAHSKEAGIMENLKLKQMFVKAKEAMVENDDRIIRSYKNRMAECTNTFNECTKIIRDTGLHKMMIMNSDCGFSEAFIKLMTGNSHLKIIRWEDTNPIFEVGGYVLQPSHIEILEKYIDSPMCSVYRNSNQTELRFKQKQNLMEAVFLDRTINIPVCSTFCFDLNENRIRTTDSNISPVRFEGVRNPHHQYYQCLGNNEPKMNEYLAAGDYVNAVIQAQGCVPFWNIGDEAVTSRFTDDYLWNIGKSIYKLPDGTMVNCREAVAWLEKKEEK